MWKNLALFAVSSFICLVGACGFFYWLATSHDTLFSKGYSEAKFESIALGAERETVVSVLGSPLLTPFERTNRGWREWLCYSAPKDDGNFLRRYVVLDETGRVVEKISDLYFD